MSDDLEDQGNVLMIVVEKENGVEFISKDTQDFAKSMNAFKIYLHEASCRECQNQTLN